MIVILTLSPCLRNRTDVDPSWCHECVRVDLRPELHFLDDRVRLVLARLTGLHGRLVLELPVVHELAHRRTGGRRHLDQVQVVLLCKLQCLGQRDNAHLLATGTDKSHLGNAQNPVVDAGLGADGSSSVSTTRPSGGRPRLSLLDRPNRAEAQKMPRDDHRRGSKHYRSTAAVMPRGALSGDSIVRTERWWPPDRGDPPSRGTVRWEIGASTCGPDIPVRPVITQG
ncbi:hypothetical protein SALBM311S_12792 [Streptomyces alboniger]